MVHLDASDTMAFGPVGECIYCGQRDAALSDEHIIPFSLNSPLRLTAASCPDCRVITGRIEQIVTRTMMGAFRVVGGLRTRRPKQRPSVLPLTLKYHHGPEIRDVSVEDHPGDTAVFHFPKAQVLTGEFTNEISMRIAGWTWRVPDEFKTGAKSAALTNPGKPIEFARMVAKIAHSCATLYLGVDGFEPLLGPTILRTDVNPWCLVGGDLEPLEPSAEPNHELRVEADNGFVMCRIRLFANFPGSPVYRVVTGRTNQHTLERIRPDPFYPKATKRKGGKTLA